MIMPVCLDILPSYSATHLFPNTGHSKPVRRAPMPSTPTEKLPTRHKAIVIALSGYVNLKEVDLPELGPKQLLVKVGAASQSSCDCA